MTVDGDELFHVERILEHRYVPRGHQKKLQYQVKYPGYGVEHNSWEPEACLSLAAEAVQAYWDSVRSAAPE